MATACTRSGFITDGACFTQPNFNRHQQWAMLVWRLALWSDSVAGTSYTNEVTGSYGDLLTDSNDATCGMTEDQMFAALIAVFNDAIGGGESLAFTDTVTAWSTQSAAASAIRCINNLTDDQLKKAALFLVCKIVGAVAEN